MSSRIIDFFKKHLLNYLFWLCWIFVAVSGGYSPVVVCRLLITVASLFVAHGL